MQKNNKVYVVTRFEYGSEWESHMYFSTKKKAEEWLKDRNYIQELLTPKIRGEINDYLEYISIYDSQPGWEETDYDNYESILVYEARDYIHNKWFPLESNHLIEEMVHSIYPLYELSYSLSVADLH